MTREHKPYNHHRSIRLVCGQIAHVAAVYQYSYAGRAMASESPHGPDHDCLMCSDARAALGHRPLDPDPRLTAIARAILERAEQSDAETVRIRFAPVALHLLAPTLTVSAGVGALLGAVAALAVLL